MSASGRVCENGIFAVSRGQNACSIVQGDCTAGEDWSNDMFDVKRRFSRLFGSHCVVLLHSVVREVLW